MYTPRNTHYEVYEVSGRFRPESSEIPLRDNSPAEKKHLFVEPGFAVYRKCLDGL